MEQVVVRIPVLRASLTARAHARPRAIHILVHFALMDAVRFLVVVEYLDISVAVCTAFQCNAKFGLWTLLDFGARFRLFERTAQQACTHLIALFRELACARPCALAARLGTLAPRAPF